MKFTHLAYVLLAFTASAHAQSAVPADYLKNPDDYLKIDVHHHNDDESCVDAPFEAVQRAVSDYDHYPCNPAAKLPLSEEILNRFGFSPSEQTKGGWDIQLANLTYAGSWDAKPVSGAPAPATLPPEMRNRWVWLQFQPLNLGCHADTQECRDLALLYPRLLLYCVPTTSADGNQISNHCKLAKNRMIDGSETPALLKNFGIESYDGMTVVTKNSPRCKKDEKTKTYTQTRIDIDIQAFMKRKDLNDAIERTKLTWALKKFIETPALQETAYNDYFNAFNAGFIAELKDPRTCMVTLPPAAEIPVDIRTR